MKPSWNYFSPLWGMNNSASTCTRLTDIFTYDIISQIFPEMKVIPEEELYPFSSCGCPPQLMLFFLFEVCFLMGQLLLLLNYNNVAYTAPSGDKTQPSSDSCFLL